MIAEIRDIQLSFSRAHTTLSGMTQSLDELLKKLFGRSVLSKSDALKLMGEGKQVDI
jgi:hypothetical protein